MIHWLSRQEKIASFEAHLPRPQVISNDSQILPQHSGVKKPPISIAKHPSFPSCQLSLIKEKHHAPDFTYYLKVFLNSFISKPIQNRFLNDSTLPFKKVDVYNMFHFHPEGIQDNDEENDLVKALPQSSQNPHGRFDTVIAIINDEAESTGVASELSIDESLH